MIGEHLLLRVQLHHGRGEAAEQRRIDIGRSTADAVEYLRQRAHSQAVASAAEIDQQQLARAAIALQLRRPGAAHVPHRRKRRDDQ